MRFSVSQNQVPQIYEIFQSMQSHFRKSERRLHEIPARSFTSALKCRYISFGNSKLRRDESFPPIPQVGWIMACNCTGKNRTRRRSSTESVRVLPRGTAVAAVARSGTGRTQRYVTRLEICKRCEKVKFFFGRMRCGVCGCFLEIKAWFPRLHCPENRW